MPFGKIIKSLFSSPASEEAEDNAVAERLEYESFIIEAAPISEGGQFRTAGYISGELEGETKRVKFIRADQNSDKQAAIDHSIAKAKQIINERGTELLSRDQL